jgi:hypothetical protein
MVCTAWQCVSRVLMWNNCSLVRNFAVPFVRLGVLPVKVSELFQWTRFLETGELCKGEAGLEAVGVERWERSWTSVNGCRIAFIDRLNSDFSEQSEDNEDLGNEAGGILKILSSFGLLQEERVLLNGSFIYDGQADTSVEIEGVFALSDGRSIVSRVKYRLQTGLGFGSATPGGRIVQGYIC